MQNFEYCNPTRIVFGKGTITELDRLVPAEARVLLVYGGGSITRNGVYDQVKAALGARTVLEFGGIEPNPAYETCMEAVQLARRENVNFLLAAGGGSVIDGAKFIAAAVPFTEGDPWLFLEKRGEVIPKAAVPLGVVLTLPASGSEMNAIAVISHRGGGEKRAFDAPLLYPRFSILDPEATFSLPLNQVRNGIVDTFVHVVEQYLTYPAEASLQDRQAEAIILTVLDEGPKTLANPTDYAARANIVWCATNAFNRSLSCGVPVDFATHNIGHELTAVYGMAHAESLAVVLASRWRLQKTAKQAKLAQFARRVWGVTEPNPAVAAELAITHTLDFFHRLGMPSRLRDYGISAVEAAEKIAARLAARRAVFGEHADVTPDKVAAILRMAE
ncbi:MAG TPA: iron-containing alcohol dehydrogenase [Armatimonadota bacterium]|mgnify:CR=1 FL=1|nr:iron-containing alcohol dehydrogenase [Armatimonadota bacterium]